MPERANRRFETIQTHGEHVVPSRTKLRANVSPVNTAARTIGLAPFPLTHLWYEVNPVQSSNALSNIDKSFRFHKSADAVEVFNLTKRGFSYGRFGNVGLPSTSFNKLLTMTSLPWKCLRSAFWL